MTEIKPIETIYNGYRFRSRLEARWAVFFDAIGIMYEYEPEGLILSDGTEYLPDFYLPQFSCYFEVKRKGIYGTSEAIEAIRKIRNGSDTDSWAGIICFGDPYEYKMFIFCQEYNDSSGGSYEAEIVIEYDYTDNRPILVSWRDHRHRTFITSFSDAKEIPLWTGSEYARYIWDSDFLYNKDGFSTAIKNAALKARQARFEHGETPKFN